MEQLPALQDLKRLAWNLAQLVACAAVGAAVVLVSLRFTNQARQVESRAQAEEDAIRSKLFRARDEEQELREKLARYRSIDEQGLIGQEHRLDWVEQIRRIKKERRLIEVQYELLPQKPVDPALLPGGAGPFEFMESTMNLHMLLLHEEDLLNFLSDLRASVGAYIRVRKCDVDRLQPGSPGGSGMAQLRAECVLEWITLREKK